MAAAFFAVIREELAVLPQDRLLKADQGQLYLPYRRLNENQ